MHFLSFKVPNMCINYLWPYINNKQPKISGTHSSKHLFGPWVCTFQVIWVWPRWSHVYSLMCLCLAVGHWGRVVHIWQFGWVCTHWLDIGWSRMVLARKSRAIKLCSMCHSFSNRLVQACFHGHGKEQEQVAIIRQAYQASLHCTL